jgi:hypothetical protein
MFHDVERPFEHIFYILGIQKSDFYIFAEVMFFVGEWPWESTMCLRDVLKNNFGEVDEPMFQSDEIPCELILCMLSIEKGDLKSLKCYFNRRMALTTNILPSELLKMQLMWCRWSNLSWCRKAIRSHFLHSVQSKKRIGRSRGSD